MLVNVSRENSCSVSLMCDNPKRYRYFVHTIASETVLALLVGRLSEETTRAQWFKDVKFKKIDCELTANGSNCYRDLQNTWQKLRTDKDYVYDILFSARKRGTILATVELMCQKTSFISDHEKKKAH